MSCFRKLGRRDEKGVRMGVRHSQVHMQQQRQKSKPLFGKARCGSGRKKSCGSVWKECLKKKSSKKKCSKNGIFFPEWGEEGRRVSLVDFFFEK